MAKWRSEIHQLIHAFYNVEIASTNKRHFGIILTLIGFLLYAFYTILFQIETFRHKPRMDFASYFFEFGVFNLGVLLFFLLFLPIKGLPFFKCKMPHLVFTRGLFSVVCVWFYSLVSIWTSNIGNALLYSTDATWTLLVLAYLGVKVQKYGVYGILIGLAGVVIVYAYELSHLQDLIGGGFGLTSGFFLGLLIIMTRFIVQNDDALTIGFYQGVVGVITSFVIWIIAICFTSFSLPPFQGVLTMLFSGFVFGVALFCFVEAVMYAEAHIIGVISYFLPVFMIILEWIVYQKEISLPSLIGVILIISGGLITIYASYGQGVFPTKKLPGTHLP